jgi:hypothetical protein
MGSESSDEPEPVPAPVEVGANVDRQVLHSTVWVHSDLPHDAQRFELPGRNLNALGPALGEFKLVKIRTESAIGFVDLPFVP